MSERAARLCIARALAVEPGALLMDEPCSALDPIATGKIGATKELFTTPCDRRTEDYLTCRFG